MQDEIADLFDQLDTDGDGMITRIEWRRCREAANGGVVQDWETGKYDPVELLKHPNNIRLASLIASPGRGREPA
jgi:hypothetical protein